MRGEMVVDNGIDGMQVLNFPYKAQHGMPLGKLFESTVVGPHH